MGVGNLISTSKPVDSGTHLQTSSNDGNLSVMAMADLQQKSSHHEIQRNKLVPKPGKKYAFIAPAPAPGAKASISVTTGGFISGRQGHVLLLCRVVGISDHEKFLQREADNRDAHAAQVNSDVVMDDRMAVARDLHAKR